MGVEFSQNVFDTICERITNGESLRKICEDEHMPNRSNVFRWMAQEGAEELRDQYARARDAQADAYADDCVYIADNAKDAAIARVQIDARKWHASKLAPKKYGDKIQHTGEGGGALQVVINK